jgi:glutamyl-tRNA synthetase
VRRGRHTVKLVNLDDIGADFIAALPGEQVLPPPHMWVPAHDFELAQILDANQALALRALPLNATAPAPPRQGLRNWAGFRRPTNTSAPSSSLSSPTQAASGSAAWIRPGAETGPGFAVGYQPSAPGADWFARIRELTARQGFAPTQKAYKKDSSAYPSSIRGMSQIIHVLLTGTTRSLDVAVADILGTQRIFASEVVDVVPAPRRALVDSNLSRQD